LDIRDVRGVRACVAKDQKPVPDVNNVDEKIASVILSGACDRELNPHGRNDAMDMRVQTELLVPSGAAR